MEIFCESRHARPQRLLLPESIKYMTKGGTNSRIATYNTFPQRLNLGVFSYFTFRTPYLRSLRPKRSERAVAVKPRAVDGCKLGIHLLEQRPLRLAIQLAEQHAHFVRTGDDMSKVSRSAGWNMPSFLKQHQGSGWKVVCKSQGCS